VKSREGAYSAGRLRSFENLANNQHKGEISSKGSARVKEVVNWMAYAEARQVLSPEHEARGKGVKLTLLTLTLPSAQGALTDKEIKSKCLNQFLIELKKVHRVVYYTWKAEKQLNGNLHFHLVLDTTIPWQDLRNSWNRIINKLGFVDRYKEKFIGMSFAQYKANREYSGFHNLEKIKKGYAYGLLTSWESPNTTDIARIENIDNMAAYLSKYVGKKIEKSLPWFPGEQAGKSEMIRYQVRLAKVKADNLKIRNSKDNQIEGKIWACSQMLSKLRKYRAFENDGYFDFQKYFSKSAQELGLKVHFHEYCTSVDLTSVFWDSPLSIPLEKFLAEYAAACFDPPKIPDYNPQNFRPSFDLPRQLSLAFASN